ncbi:MAG: hypothetical protein MRY63_12115 [Neomegalonema sp.]|nr:hypothetical protein [Neomegalonema sp.]
MSDQAASSPSSAEHRLPRGLGQALMAALATGPAAVRALESSHLQRGGARVDPTIWRPSMRTAAELASARLLQYTPQARSEAINTAARETTVALTNGVRKLAMVEPYPRPEQAPPVWRSGSATLIPYAPTCGEHEQGEPVLVIPSLVNRPDVLDMTPQRSLLRSLARKGHPAYLLDWGDPGAQERRFTLNDYVLERILPACAVVAALHPAGTISLIGHCLGGALAMGASVLDHARGDRRVGALTLIGTPWDFAPVQMRGGIAPPRGELERLIALCEASFGGLPPCVLDTLFFLRDPLQAMRKFPSFLEMAPKGERARMFATVERWLREGVRLASPAARQLLIEWGMDNATMRGHWQIDGQRITPRAVPVPMAIIASASDTITPVESALAPMHGARAARFAQRISPRSGHIGMLVGTRAESELIAPLTRFLAHHRGAGPAPP